jgi:hypothetical protein
MTTLAQSFAALVATLKHCPEAEEVQVYLANLVSLLAALPTRRACVALVCPKTLSRYQGLEHALPLLESYGIRLFKAWHQQDNAFFLFAELTEPDPDPYAGAAVIVLEPDDILTGAAELERAA